MAASSFSAQCGKEGYQGFPGFKPEIKIVGSKLMFLADFDRYNVVSESDLKLASQKLAAYLPENHGHNMGTIQKKRRKQLSFNLM
jgi:hypothetical protein